MPASNRPGDQDLVEVTEKLTQGIAACRSVIANYRSLLANDDFPEGAAPCPPLKGAPASANDDAEL